MAGMEKPNIEEQLKDNVVSVKEATDIRDYLKSTVTPQEKQVLKDKIWEKKSELLSWLEKTIDLYTKNSLDKTVDDSANAMWVANFENIISYFKSNSWPGQMFEANGQMKRLFDGIEKKVLDYKTNVIKKSLDKDLSSRLDLYTTLEDTVKDIIKTAVQKEQTHAIREYYKEMQNLNNKYSDVVVRKTTPKFSEYWEKVDKILAAVNRSSLLSGFQENITLVPSLNSDPQSAKVSAAFEEMLSTTSDVAINAMVKDLAVNGHDDLAFQAIFKKVKQELTSKDYKPVSLLNFRVIQDGKWLTSSKREVVQRIEEPVTIRSLDMNQMKSSLEPMVSNPAIKQILIIAPTDQKEVVEYFYKNTPNKDKVILQLVDGLKKVTVESTEITETPGTIALQLPRLDANGIANPAEVTKLLSQNPDMKALIQDPNYKITWGTITGVASLNTNIWYSVKPEYDYTRNKNVLVKNETTIKNNPNVIGNQNLALNRAGSFLKSFYDMTSKVSPDAKFNLNYKVDGPNKDELKKANPNASEADLAELFKQWQNASLDLTVLKTETKKQVANIDVKEVTHTKDYAFTVWLNQTTTSVIRELPGQIFSWIGSALTSLIPDFSGSGHVKFKGCNCSKH